MSEDKCKIHFNPDNLEIIVERGANLLSAALAAGVHISASCNSLGACGTCKIKIENGSVKSTRTDKLTPEEYDRGIRQACRCQVISDLTVSIPIESRVDRGVRARERNRASGVTASGWKYNPPLKKYLLNLPPASASDNSTDYFRVMYGLARYHNLPDWPIDPDVLIKLPRVLREKDWQVTVTLAAVSDRPPGQDFFVYKIINVEPGDTRGHIYAIAVDIGTTTICAQLLELNRGLVLAETSVLNKQKIQGDNVAATLAELLKKDGLKNLQAAVVDSVNTAIKNLLFNSQVERSRIDYISTAGNTTIQHILVGYDPQNILKPPFIPVANTIPMIKAKSLGLDLPDHVFLFSFPNVSSFIGGDISAGIVASGMQQRKKLTLYLDIGPSSEVVIGNSEWMVSAACFAQPVFEGRDIRHGMIAVSGAIQDVEINSKLEPTLKTIGETDPQGICGAGLISAAASLLTAGLIDQKGHFILPTASSRVRKGPEGHEFVLVKAADSATAKDIVITENDLAKLMTAKAAIYTGCQILARSVNVGPENLEQVIIAGSIGSRLDIEKAITIGLLPDIAREKIIYIGNGALSGARLVTFSTELLDDSRIVAQMMTDMQVEHAGNYTEIFEAALAFPHNEAALFPTITLKLKPAG
jgi:uncharacterized 2Fe-2S/4Fe-4S cluster protein (DUF4445 family)